MTTSINTTKAVKDFTFLALIFTLIFSIKATAQNPENWTSKQLIEPVELAKIIGTEKDVPVILSVGPGAPIPQSIEIGSVKDKGNMAKLREQLSTLSKDTSIVIYCGCCPFEHCPNVRPAIDALKEMNFVNYRLLNLPNNIKTDWIDKGLPTKEM